MLPRSCYCVCCAYKRAASASRRVEDTLAPREEAPPHPRRTGRSSISLTRWPQPLPGRGGPAPRDPPPPPGSSAATSCPRLRGRRLLLLVSAPTCPHTRSALTPRQVRVSALAVAAGSDDPTWRPARHFLIRLLRAQSRQPLRRLHSRERACVVSCPAEATAGGKSARWGVLDLHDNGRMAGGGAKNGTQVGGVSSR